MKTLSTHFVQCREIGEEGGGREGRCSGLLQTALVLHIRLHIATARDVDVRAFNNNNKIHAYSGEDKQGQVAETAHELLTRFRHSIALKPP